MTTALVVHLEIVEEKVQEFLDIVRAHGENSLKTEADCLCFDVLVSEAEPNNIILVEKYSDKNALQAHWDSPHMARYREKTKAMILSRQATVCTV